MSRAQRDLLIVSVRFFLIHCSAFISCVSRRVPCSLFLALDLLCSPFRIGGHYETSCFRSDSSRCIDKRLRSEPCRRFSRWSRIGAPQELFQPSRLERQSKRREQ